MATASFSFISKEFVICIPTVVLTWVIGLAVYRRFFHPLASVPGPFLAAITDLYAFKFNVLSKRSQFFLEIDKLHQEYGWPNLIMLPIPSYLGPIVRIKPNEVHLCDPENYDKIYYTGTPFTKDADFYGGFANPTAAFGTPGNELHRIRRAALDPFFSRKKVLELEHVVQSKAQVLRKRVEEALAAGQPADLFHAYRALSIDVISGYAFDHSWDLLEKADYGADFFDAAGGLGPTRWIFGAFPFLESMSRRLPLWLTPHLSGILAQLKGLQHNLAIEIQQVKDNLANGKEQEPSRKTIFHQLLDPNATQGHRLLSTSDISDEAFVLVTAAADTVGHALQVLTYHILRNERVRLRLSNELKQAFPNPNATMDFLALEKLPYLTAVVKEGLRLSYGVPGRLPRVTPKSGATFNGYEIPGGSVVGMSAWCMHRNPQAFPDPDTFDPDR